MKIDEIQIGKRVRIMVDSSGVRKGTEGVIDEDYGIGIMVAWDVPDCPLPEGYSAYDEKFAFLIGMKRNAFEKATGLDFLEVVE